MTNPHESMEQFVTLTGQGWQFFYNSATNFGELHANRFKIPLVDSDATSFVDASPEVRQQLVVSHVKAREALAAAKKQARGGMRGA